MALRVAAVALWAPVAVVDGVVEGGVSLAGVAFMAGSGLLHVGDFSALLLSVAAAIPSSASAPPRSASRAAG